MYNFENHVDMMRIVEFPRRHGTEWGGMVINFIFSRICQSNILAGYLASGEVRSVAKRSMAILLVTTCPSSRGTRFVLRNLLSPPLPPSPPGSRCGVESQR